MKIHRLLLGAVLSIAAARPVSAAVSVPSGFVADTFASGLSQPTAMKFAPDNRLFILQQNGTIRIVKNGQLLPTPFLQLNVENRGERGLLGMAFDPNFSQSRFVYLYYSRPATSTEAAHNRVVRIRASATNPDVALPGTEYTLLRLPDLTSATNHNGGALIEKNGKLFIAVGDNTVRSRPQEVNNVFGKILRINLNGSIPTDNPYYNQNTGIAKSVWAYGLRNPFGLAMHANTKTIYVNDVGENTWEEINVARASFNYGWPQTEGPTSQSGISSPIFAYSHDGTPGGCSIVDGEFYWPRVFRFPDQYKGRLFFADYCGGWVRTLDSARRQSFAFGTGFEFPVAIEVNQYGHLFVLERGFSGNGKVTRVRYQPSSGLTAGSKNES